MNICDDKNDKIQRQEIEFPRFEKAALAGLVSSTFSAPQRNTHQPA
jgi:hypothetical protein